MPCRTVAFLLLALLATPLVAEPPKPAFRPAGEGLYEAQAGADDPFNRFEGRDD